MSDTKKEFPINEMSGYNNISVQLADPTSLNVYSRGDNALLGIIVKNENMAEPIFYTYEQSDGYLSYATMFEISTYMSSFRFLPISVKFEEDKYEK